MKKCVQEGPVTPMADDWWDTILTMIPAKLVLSPQLQSHIKQLYNEVKVEYEASIRKAMGECTSMHCYNSTCSLLVFISGL